MKPVALQKAFGSRTLVRLGKSTLHFTSECITLKNGVTRIRE